MEEVDAVAHPPNISDNAIAEDGRAYPSTERRKIEHNNKEWKEYVTDIPFEIPHQRPAAECEHVPAKRRFPLAAGEVQVTNQKSRQEKRQLVEDRRTQVNIPMRNNAKETGSDH